VIDTILASGNLLSPGDTRLTGGFIANIGGGTSVPQGAVDCGGDMALRSRTAPACDRPHQATNVAHDAELAGVGFTTVFDALRVVTVIANDKTNDGKVARGLVDDILGLCALRDRFGARHMTCRRYCRVRV
jgi:alpha-D-ribose 1-methylphosphonate 5-triphosphate diphosphatase